MYLTPGRYRAAGFGMDLSEVEDPELRAVLARASSLVDVYCGVPVQPSQFSFGGGSVTGEQHMWQLATDVTIGSRRVYLTHRPVKAITAFVVKFTTSYQIAIQPADIYVNHREGWAEVVSLAAVVSGLYPVGLNFGLYTPIAEVDYTYGFGFSENEEELTIVDGNAYQGVRGFWDPDPVIKIDGSIVTSGFEVDLEEGVVEFDTPQSADSTITATYNYTLPDAIPEATGLIATHLLAERELAAKGMAALNTIKVAEISLQRTRSRSGQDLQSQDSIPVQAANLLDPYRYRSVA